MNQILKEYLRGLVRTRENESNKHDYGHALLVCGCSTMPGAAVLATGAALKSGCGLVTLHSTSSATLSAVSQFPSAMLSIDHNDCFSELPDNLSRFGSIGVGPGLGKTPVTVTALTELLNQAHSMKIPMVIDADAINIIATNPRLMDLVPEGSIFTPHDGELKRLLPEWTEGDEDILLSFVNEYGCVLVKKGFHTRIYSPGAEPYLNTTGNPGLAKGGSGDVLTGLLAGLLARGYGALSAALLGVWIHGFAGDVLTEECTAEAWNSRDLIDRLYCGFTSLF